VADSVSEHRQEHQGGKIYALGDAYPHADFVTYPSLVEGFGNALLETIYFKKPALVNRYSVYKADIAPKGFSFVEIDGKITPEAVALVRELLESPSRRREMVERNYRIARRHFSYRALQEVLKSEHKVDGGVVMKETASVPRVKAKALLTGPQAGTRPGGCSLKQPGEEGPGTCTSR
jgi:mannosylglucosylglycerate synthase